MASEGELPPPITQSHPRLIGDKSMGETCNRVAWHQVGKVEKVSSPKKMQELHTSCQLLIGQAAGETQMFPPHCC